MHLEGQKHAGYVESQSFCTEQPIVRNSLSFAQKFEAKYIAVSNSAYLTPCLE